MDAFRPRSLQAETANAQGPVIDISLTVGLCWRLDIRKDGPARICYREATVEYVAQAGPGTITNFDNLVNRLIEHPLLIGKATGAWSSSSTGRGRLPLKGDSFEMPRF